MSQDGEAASSSVSEILFVRSATEPSCFAAARKTLEASKDPRIAETATLEECDARIKGTSDWRGLVVLVVLGKDSFLPVVNFLSAHQARIRTRKTMRVAVFNKMDHAKVIEILMGKGCSEIVEDFGLSERAFLHKVSRHMKIIEQAAGALGAATDISMRSPAGGRAAGAGAEPASSGPVTVKLSEALSLPSDIWLVQRKSEARKVMGKWLIDVMGPGPAAGSWEALPAKGEAGQAWEWTPRVKAGPFAIPDGRWVFFGRQPEFDWSKNRWRFVAERPRLCFYEGAELKAPRFFHEPPETLLLANNSPQAIAKIPFMVETFDPEFEFRIDGTGRIVGVKIKKDGSGPDWKKGDLSREESKLDWNTGKISAEAAAAAARDWNNALTEDAPPADWNNRLTPDAPAPAWGRGGASEGDEDPGLGEFATGAEALLPARLLAYLDGKAVDLLETEAPVLKMDTAERFGKGDRPKLRLVSENLDPSVDLQMEGVIEDAIDCEDRRLLEYRILDRQAAEHLQRAVLAVHNRQVQALRFLKLAKGY